MLYRVCVHAAFCYLVHVKLHHDMSYGVMLGYVTLRYAIHFVYTLCARQVPIRYIMPHYIASHCTMTCHVIACYDMLCHAMLC